MSRILRNNDTIARGFAKYVNLFNANSKWTLFSFKVPHRQYKIYVKSGAEDILVYDTYAKPGPVNNYGMMLNEMDLDWRFLHIFPYVFSLNHPLKGKNAFAFDEFYARKFELATGKKVDSTYMKIDLHCPENILLSKKIPCSETTQIIDLGEVN
ncbi:hypothetical protein K2P97_07100 [bacterium]|nr:hypothetical protein [bacterium]